MQLTVNVRELIREEITAFTKFKETKKEFLTKTLQSAAQKLEPYVEDHSTICAILTSYFPKELERDIREYIPNKYKRAYQSQENYKMPIDLLDEALVWMEDVLEEASTIISEIRKKYRAASKEDREGLNKFIIEQFGGIAELKKMITEWQTLSVDLAEIKNMHDERLRIDAFTKFMLRIQTFYLSKNNIANLQKISSKWVKVGIQNHDELEELAMLLWQTNAKWSTIQAWFNRQKIRVEKGLGAEPIPSPTLTLPEYEKLIQKYDESVIDHSVTV